MKLYKILLLIIIFTLFTININAKIYDRILAIVNEEIITLFDLKDNFFKIRETFIKTGQHPPRNLKSSIFDRLINQRLIEQIAKEKELFVSESEINQAIENIKAMNRWSDKAFREELKRAGKTLEELREDYRRQILTDKIISIEVKSQIEEPTEDEMKEYYIKHKKEMYEPPKIRVKHILIMDNPNASLSVREKLKKKAKKILKRALAGENFEKLARKYSEDEASAPLGGDIGYIQKGEWLPEIDDVLFRLRKGQIAPQLLYSRWGWHIVKVVDKKRKRKLKFEDVKFNIKNRIIAEKLEQKYKEWIEEQKENSYIEVILENNEKFIYYNGRWKKKGGKKILSNEELYNRIEKLKL